MALRSALAAVDANTSLQNLSAHKSDAIIVIAAITNHYQLRRMEPNNKGEQNLFL